MKDDQEMTPLESLFQDKAAVNESCQPAPASSHVDDPSASDGIAAVAGTQAEMPAAAPTAAPAAAPAAAPVAAPTVAPAAAPTVAPVAAPTVAPAAAPAAAPETASAAAADDRPYEELVRELEQIVRRLESGDITLDQSMDLFARGIELTRRCQNQLDAIEKKITILIENPDGSLTEQPFAESAND